MQASDQHISPYQRLKAQTDQDLSEINAQPEQKLVTMALLRWGNILSQKKSEEMFQVAKAINAHGYGLAVLDLLPIKEIARRKAVLKASKTLSVEVLKNAEFASTILKAAEKQKGPDFEDLKKIIVEHYKAVTDAQVKCLAEFIQVDQKFAFLDGHRLSTSFPFPLDGPSLLRTLIQLSPDEPSRTLRNIAVCQPFFTLVRNLLDGLSEDRFKIAIVVPTQSERDRVPWYSNQNLDERALDFIAFAVNNSKSLLADYREDQPQYLCVRVPDFPTVETGESGQRFARQLQAEIFDYIFCNKKDGAVLNRKWYTKGKRKRIHINSVLNQLSGDQAYQKKLENFRKHFEEAKKSKRQIVLTYNGFANVDLFALGFRTCYEGTNPCAGFNEVKDLPIILGLRGGESLNGKQYTVSGWVWAPPSGIFEQKPPRILHVKKSIFSPALKNLCEPSFSASKQYPSFHFVSRLQAILDIPGYRIGETIHNFLLLAEKQFGENVTRPQLLEFALERMGSISEAQANKLLEALSENTSEPLTERSKELLVNRFSIPTSTLQHFQTFSQYRPKTVGEMPRICVRRTTLSEYRKLGLASCGYAEESKQLAEHLKTSTLVTIVDATGYYPEIKTDNKADAKQLLVDDKQNYYRPARRVINGFVKNIITGQEPGLENYSVVSIQAPDKVDAQTATLIKLMHGIEVEAQPDMSAINDLLSELAIYDDHSILIIEADYIDDITKLDRTRRVLSELGIKAIITARESIPGVPQVLLMPLSRQEVSRRVISESQSITEELGLKTEIDSAFVNFTSNNIETLRRAEEDPMHVALSVLRNAARTAIGNGRNELAQSDLTAGIASVFHLPDINRTIHLRRSVNEFREEIKGVVFGQPEAHEQVADKLSAHFTGLRLADRPLSMLWPGPTGVGKTESVVRAAKYLHLPFYAIDGSQFGEAHMASSLFGSPPGYVGDNEGQLFKFLRDNPVYLLFIDELDKMHPNVRMTLMNLIDKGQAKAGSGQVIYRPGGVLIAATNAGARDLTHGQDMAKVLEILAKAFRDESGNPRPEFVARWDVIPFLPIQKPAFDQVLTETLRSLGDRFGFLKANLALRDVTPEASELLYRKSQEICANLDAKRTIGFHQAFRDQGIIDPDSLGPFVNMRYPVRAMENLALKNLQRIVDAQYEKPETLISATPRQIRMIVRGDFIDFEDFPNVA